MCLQLTGLVDHTPVNCVGKVGHPTDYTCICFLKIRCNFTEINVQYLQRSNICDRLLFSRKALKTFNFLVLNRLRDETATNKGIEKDCFCIRPFDCKSLAKTKKDWWYCTKYFFKPFYTPEGSYCVMVSSVCPCSVSES